MTVQALEHVTIRCANLKRTRDFYVELMGLSEGERPAFPFRGHWLYLGGVPVIHLVEASDSAGAWGGRLVIPTPEEGTGSFDHVAFRGDDFQVQCAIVHKLLGDGRISQSRINILQNLQMIAQLYFFCLFIADELLPQFVYYFTHLAVFMKFLE